MQILDVSLSDAYEKRHIEDAWFVPRARLKAALGVIPEAETYVLTSGDGVVAQLTASELQALTEKNVLVLKGGNTGWETAGLALQSGGGRKSLKPDDMWQIPFLPDPDGGKSAEENMRDYLSWEVELINQIDRDGTTNFRHFPG